MTLKTQQEIRARFDQFDLIGKDPFGFHREALATAMEYDTAADLVDGVTADDWVKPDIAKTSREYLEFAITKAVNHRGLSANRSIMKLGEMVWCLGDDALTDRFEKADYEQYGAPKLAVLAEAWGLATDAMQTEAWQRMATGQPCHEGCDEGCAS